MNDKHTDLAEVLPYSPGFDLEDRMGKGFEGGPNGAQAAFLARFGQFLLKTYKPKAIVVFSAHWETANDEPIQITNNTADWQADSQNLYFDYYGFPKAMYQLKFSSKPDEGVSKRVADLLAKADIKSQLVPNKRGFDHGVFVPFKIMFGDSCDVPIIEVSQYIEAEKNITVGRALHELGKEGILLLSGGLTIHTFQDFSAFSAGGAKQGYKDFETELKTTLDVQDATSRNDQLTQIMEDPWFKKAHPTVEHFTPIYIAAGAGGDGGSKVVSDLHGAITVAFGT